MVDVQVRLLLPALLAHSRGSRGRPASPPPGRGPRTAEHSGDTGPVGASTTPNRYSRPQVRWPRSGHSGSPSKSKKMSPALGGGSSASVFSGITPKRMRVLFAVLDVPDLTVRRADAALHPGLVLQAQQRGAGLGQGGFARAPVTVRIPSCVEFLALGRVHPRHEEQIVGGVDLFLAVVAAAAGGEPGRAPTARCRAARCARRSAPGTGPAARGRPAGSPRVCGGCGRSRSRRPGS